MKRELSPGTVVVVIVIVLVLVGALYYMLMFRPKQGGDAPFAGKGPPMTKMKGGAGAMPQGGAPMGQ